MTQTTRLTSDEFAVMRRLHRGEQAYGDAEILVALKSGGLIKRSEAGWAITASGYCAYVHEINQAFDRRQMVDAQPVKRPSFGYRLLKLLG